MWRCRGNFYAQTGADGTRSFRTHLPAAMDAKVPNPERGVDAEAKAGGPDASGLVSEDLGK